MIPTRNTFLTASATLGVYKERRYVVPTFIYRSFGS